MLCSACVMHIHESRIIKSAFFLHTHSQSHSPCFWRFIQCIQCILKRSYNISSRWDAIWMLLLIVIMTMIHFFCHGASFFFLFHTKPTKLKLDYPNWSLRHCYMWCIITISTILALSVATNKRVANNNVNSCIHAFELYLCECFIWT